MSGYPSGESGGRILPSILPTSTGTTHMRYESTGITNAFPPYNFSFLGGSKKKRTKRKIQKKRTSKYRKTRKSRKIK